MEMCLGEPHDVSRASLSYQTGMFLYFNIENERERHKGYDNGNF